MRGALSALVLLAAVSATLAILPADSTIQGAARKYKWGVPVWREEYEPKGADHMKNPITGVPLTGPGGYEGLNGPPYNPTPMTKVFKNSWSVNHWDAIGWRFGMLALMGRPDGSEVRMTRKGSGAQYGRWESKMTLRNAKSTTNSWFALLELVPVRARDYHCGAQTITYSNYTKGTLKASMQINALPKNSYQHWIPLSKGTESSYHAYGVEVTHSHISWFVDDRVVMTETRKSALKHPYLTMRIRFMGTSGGQFPVPADQTPYLQFDWNRFFDLKRPNQLPINNVPKCHRVTTNPNAC